MAASAVWVAVIAAAEAADAAVEAIFDSMDGVFAAAAAAATAAPATTLDLAAAAWAATASFEGPAGIGGSVVHPHAMHGGGVPPAPPTPGSNAPAAVPAIAGGGAWGAPSRGAENAAASAGAPSDGAATAILASPGASKIPTCGSVISMCQRLRPEDIMDSARFARFADCIADIATGSRVLDAFHDNAGASTL